MEGVTRNAPVALLGVALVASAALLLYLTREMTFLQDTWEFLMNRREVTPDTLLAPHNEHIVLIPVAIEQLLLGLFGMTTARPEFVLLTVSLLAAACLLFVYVRRRVGPWSALLAAVVLLFLGPAWEVLLWPFELSFSGSVLFGIAMLLALEREDRNGDIAACACLCLCFGFSSLGIPFAVAAAVDVFQKRRSRGFGRAYLVAVPLVLYAAWYVGWGSEAETHLSLHNLLVSPRFAAESAAVAVSSVLGLSSPFGHGTPALWRLAILAAVVALFAYRQRRRLGFAPGFWPVAAAAAANWLLTALNQIPGREPTSSRYQYVGAVLVLLLLANLLQGVRFNRRALQVGGALTALVVASNLFVLRDGKSVLMQQSVLTQSDLAAIEIARRTIDPELAFTSDLAGTTTLIDVQPAKYLPAVREHGSPAYTPSELAEAPGQGRRQADIVLSQALPLSTLTRLGAYDPRDSGENCVTLPAGGSSPASEVRVSPGLTRIELAPGPHADFSLRRFATGEFPIPTEGAPGGSVTTLRVPRDRAPRWPWYLHVDAAQLTRVCR